MITDYILIIGAMKSGTTTLFDQLARDPRIAGASPKEPGFFAFEEVRSMGWDWYEGLFGFAPDQHAYALEGSTDYTKAPFVTGVAERLEAARAEGRRFKLIYAMREPVSRLLSHARHAQADGKEVGQFVSPRKRHDLDAPGGLSPVNLAVSDYVRQLEPYAGFAERGELFTTTTDAMAEDGQAVMDGLAAFLGLDDLTWHAEHERSNTKDDKTRPAPLLQAATEIEPLTRVAKAVLPKAAREAIKAAGQAPVETPGRFEPTDEERAALAARYAGQARTLRERWGVAPPAAWSAEPDAKPAP